MKFGFRQIVNNTLFQFCLITVLLIIIYIIIDQKDAWGDVDNYWIQINEILMEHKMPYSEAHFEYPPIAIIIMAVPRLLCSDLNGYHLAFAVFAGIAYLVSMWYAFRIGDHLGVSRLWIFAIFTLTVIWLNMFILMRFDIYTVMLILIAIDSYLNGKHDRATIVIGIATMLKLYPALVLFAFMYPYLCRRECKRIVRMVAICALVCVVVMLPFIIYDASTAFNWVSIHSARGIQVESVIGTILEVGSYFAPGSVEMINNYGSDNITGDVPDAIAGYMNYVLVAGILGVLLLMAHAAFRKEHTERELERSVIFTSLALILAFIVFNKVYSAQYGLWAILLVPLLHFGTNSKKENIRLVVVTQLFGWLTLIAAAAYRLSIKLYGKYVILSELSAIELAKNIATIILFILVLKMFWDQYSQDKGTEEETSQQHA